MKKSFAGYTEFFRVDIERKKILDIGLNSK